MSTGEQTRGQTRRQTRGQTRGQSGQRACTYGKNDTRMQHVCTWCKTRTQYTYEYQHLIDMLNAPSWSWSWSCWSWVCRACGWARRRSQRTAPVGPLLGAGLGAGWVSCACPVACGAARGFELVLLCVCKGNLGVEGDRLVPDAFAFSLAFGMVRVCGVSPSLAPKPLKNHSWQMDSLIAHVHACTCLRHLLFLCA